jgi:FkbM family methyltransferase
MAGVFVDKNTGMRFAWIDSDDAAFLFHEIVVRNTYWGHPAVSVASASRGAPAVIIDVGANIGLFALQTLRLLSAAPADTPAAASSPPVVVFAVEPMPQILPVLRRNLSDALASGRAVIIPAAVGAVRGAAAFCFAPDAPAESTRHPQERRDMHALLRQERLLPDRPSTEQPTTPAMEWCACPTLPLGDVIRDALEQTRAASVHMLKIDVEGDELVALRSVELSQWPKVDQVVCEVHDVGNRLAEVERLLAYDAAFPRVECVLQTSWEDEEAGYALCIPPTLRLYHVYASRLFPAHTDAPVPPTE